MLVLSRRSRQSVVIGTDIVITVIAVDGDFVKLGIDAPRSLPVLRQELLQAVSRENRLAGAGMTATTWATTPEEDGRRAAGQPMTAMAEAVRHLIPALQGMQGQQVAPEPTVTVTHDTSVPPAEPAALIP